MPENFQPVIFPFRVEAGGSGTGRTAVFAQAVPSPHGIIILVDDGGQQGVTTQLGMIVEIFESESEGKDALANQFFNGMLQAVGVAFMLEAGSQGETDAQPCVGLLEEKGATIVAKMSA